MVSESHPRADTIQHIAPVAIIPGCNSTHFLPGTVSSGTIGLIDDTPRRLPAFCTFPLTVLRLRSSKTVAAAMGSVFWKKLLSSTRIERSTGGRKISGTAAEFIGSLGKGPSFCKAGRLDAMERSDCAMNDKIASDTEVCIDGLASRDRAGHPNEPPLL